MSPNPSLNLFAMAPIQGQLDLRYNTGVLTAFLSTTSGGGLVPGQAVKRYNPGTSPTVGTNPQVVEAAADTDDIFGFVVYNIKNATFAAGYVLEVAAFRGSVMYMTANGAISGGAAVDIVVGTPGTVQPHTGSNVIIGTALDQAAAAGQLIRVIIDLPGATSGNG
jgi:hypothetical protein